MLSAFFIVIVVYGAFRVIPATRELDGNVALGAALGPAILAWLLGLIIGFMELPPALGWVGLSFFFVVPFLWLRFGLGETAKLSALAGAIVLVSAIAVQIGVELFLYGPDGVR